MVKPGGTGRPMRDISARLAPLPPSSGFIEPSPSAFLFPNRYTYLFLAIKSPSISVSFRHPPIGWKIEARKLAKAGGESTRDCAARWHGTQRISVATPQRAANESVRAATGAILPQEMERLPQKWVKTRSAGRLLRLLTHRMAPAVRAALSVR